MKFYYLLFLIFSFNLAFAQKNTVTIPRNQMDCEHVYYNTNKPPKYKGDIKILKQTIADEFTKYTLDNIKGKTLIQVKFIITCKGNVKDIEVVKSFNNSVDKNITDIISETPVWIPAYINSYVNSYAYLLVQKKGKKIKVSLTGGEHKII